MRVLTPPLQELAHQSFCRSGIPATLEARYSAADALVSLPVAPASRAAAMRRRGWDEAQVLLVEAEERPVSPMHLEFDRNSNQGSIHGYYLRRGVRLR